MVLKAGGGGGGGLKTGCTGRVGGVGWGREGAVKDCGCSGRGCWGGGVLKTAMVLVGKGGWCLFKTVVVLAGDVRKEREAH